MSHSTKNILSSLSVAKPAQKMVKNGEESLINSWVQQPKQEPKAAMSKTSMSMAEAVMESLTPRKGDPNLTPHTSR